MLSSNKLKEPVFQFLVGTFHQDINSPEEVLEELLTEESKEYLEFAIAFLTDFIRSEYTDIEKNEYIQSCADGVYFPALGLEPLQWLYEVIEQIKKPLKQDRIIKTGKEKLSYKIMQKFTFQHLN